MALFLCNAGGGDLTETTLWTNSSPNSSASGITASLSSSIANYKYIGIRYKANTSSSASTSELIVKPENLRKSTAAASVPRVAICSDNSSSYFYVRGIVYGSDTSLSFTNALRVNTSGSDSSLSIPTSIVGYN